VYNIGLNTVPCCTRATSVSGMRRARGSWGGGPLSRPTEPAVPVCTHETRAATAAAAPPHSKDWPKGGASPGGAPPPPWPPGRAARLRSDEQRAADAPTAAKGGGPGTRGSNRCSSRWPDGLTAPWPVTEVQKASTAKKQEKHKSATHACVCCTLHLWTTGGPPIPRAGSVAPSPPRCTRPSEGPGVGGCPRRGTASSPVKTEQQCQKVRGVG